MNDPVFLSVTPTKAGVQGLGCIVGVGMLWIPAFAHCCTGKASFAPARWQHHKINLRRST